MVSVLYSSSLIKFLVRMMECRLPKIHYVAIHESYQDLNCEGGTLLEIANLECHDHFNDKAHLS
jgi:hypothetical protein